MSGGPLPDAAALARERSLLASLLCDATCVVLFTGIALWSGSLTTLAELVRGTLLTLLEWLIYGLMRRIHRGRMAAFDYGSGKVEQFANLLVGLAMVAGAVWLASHAVLRFDEGAGVPGSNLSLWVATLAMVYNLATNITAGWLLWRAGRDGSSVLMTGQIRARLSKIVASAVSVLAVAVAAALPGSTAGMLADLCGTAFISVVMLGTAARLWRESLPDLLDRSLDEERQLLINRALGLHFADYDALLSVRSRSSGRVVHVRIELGFAASLPLGAVDRVIVAIAAEIGRLIPGAEVTIIPRPLPG